MGGDLYELLGVKKDASADAVKRAYHDKARKYHPDINSDRINADYFLDIQAAYDILKDPIKRKKYDDRIDDEDFGVPIVKCQISSSRRVIPRLDEDQLVYALMKVECLKQSEELNEPQVHVCLVIDKSTSMHGKRIDMVKANVVQLIATLNERDLISIVTFSDQAEVLLPPTNIANAKLIITKINQISTDGATEIKAGLKTGLDLLWQGQEKSFARHLVLLTDGHTYGDEENCYALARNAAEQGIIISALGIGHEWNDLFLEHLTAITGGSTLLVTSKEDLYQYLDKIFRSLHLVYGRKMTFINELDPKMELRLLFQLEPEIVQYSDLDKKVNIGDLFYDRESLYLLEFLVHPLIKKDKDVELLNGQIKMELSHEQHKNARLFPKLVLPITDDLKKEEPPAEIVRALSKLTLYYMQERSREDVRVGSYVRATRRLNFLASRLISEGEIHLANKVFRESESIQKTHQFSLDGEKELKYGTKKLLGLLNP